MSCVNADIAKHFRLGIQIGQKVRIRIPCELPQEVCEIFAQFNDAGTMMWYTKKGDPLDSAEEFVVFPCVGNYKSLAMT